MPEIEKEVNKLIKAGFIYELKYPTWITNIVPVRKKNRQLHICVDFQDLNEACPKDDFPLPVTELKIDSAIGHEALSLLDCTVGYNQIQMALEDQEATTFRTPKGIFCYKVMPFGLKNAGATYQRACKQSLMTCSTKQLNAMLMIWWLSPRKGWNTYETLTNF